MACGHVQDRDMNAAINLQNALPERVRLAWPELTPVDKKEPTPLVEAGSRPSRSNF
jgi:putative transposase